MRQKPTGTHQRVKSVRPRWRRAMLLTLALPPLLIALFGLSLAYRIYAGNRAEAAETRFPVLRAPRAPQRLLIFSPHCDDETLGAGGLMQQAVQSGCDVQVVLLTNGDGFRAGVSRDYHEIAVRPADYIRYAYARQGETRSALRELGVPAGHVCFLGYPDQGLMPMWTTHWSPQTPFTSRFTQTDHSPYNNSSTPDASYCGEALLKDIERQMRADRPTDIYVTHPNDDHPDHAAASVFVRTALEQLRAEGLPWAQTARVHYYLVHRGDWPAPQGLHEDYWLAPPASMAALDTQWSQLPLTHREIERKYAAIKRYHSQTEMMGRFLYSFARRNELFGTLHGPSSVPLTRVPDGVFRMDGEPGEWRGQVPVALDPAGDTVMRAFQSSADITRLYACRDSRTLYLRLDARNRLSHDVQYAITLRPIEAGPAQQEAVTLSIAPRREGVPHAVPDVPGAVYAWHSNWLEMSVPLSEVGISRKSATATLNLAASTRFARLVVDRTGYRGIACAPGSRVAERTGE